MGRDIGSPEWVLMYRQGLTAGRISQLCRVNVQQVNRAIARARRNDPGIVQEHLRKAPPAAAVTERWKARCEELTAFMAANGRPPFAAAQAPEETSLGRWLERQRAAAGKGELDEEHRRALDAVGDWRTPPRVQLEARRWRQRLEELARFAMVEGRLPSHRTPRTDTERVLGNWLHGQRRRASRGDITAGHLQALQDAVPGWNTWKTGPRLDGNSSAR
ncbi:helicase associated domain-containing protein [Arthrobacter sp. UYCo732]|uniref:helicase associated domain-containing protein n=1 Tax=Arthrobacter sp. UYCo732 TaxID=3156336 RepID=UPI003399FFE0